MHPTIFAAFNGIVSDVRVNLPASEIPPFNLQLILLIKSEELRAYPNNWYARLPKAFPVVIRIAS